MRTRKQQSGFALVMLAIIIVAIITLVAIAIDISSMGTSIAQGKGNARYAALSAIETYFATSGADHQTRMVEATTRLNEVAGLNSVLSAGEKVSNQTIGENSLMELIPGKFFYSAGSDGVNPCDSEQEPPCFVDYTGGDAVNAFRLRGELYNDVKTFFAPILGNNKVKVNVDVVSAITPRQGCFVVDLSPSMTRETHIPDANHGAAYGFYLQNPVNPGAAYSWHDERFELMSVEYPLRPGGVPVPRVHYRDDYWFVPLLNNNDYISAAPNSNYRKYHPNPDTDDITLSRLYEARPANYWVDFFRKSPYEGPQPLTAILKGLNIAVRRFEERSVAGDKMCIIFFDHNLSWPRVIRLTDNYQYIKELLEIRDESTPMSDIDKLSQHGIFPSKDSFTNILMALSEAERQFKQEKLDNPGLPVSQFIVLVTDGLSNCRACDTMLYPQFDRDGDGDVDDRDRWNAEVCAGRNASGTLYGGNRSTICANSPWNQSLQCQLGDFHPSGGCKWMNLNGNNTIDNSEWDVFTEAEGQSYQCRTTSGCQNSYSAYELASAELKSYVEHTITPQRIPIHVMMVGDHVAPNNIDVADPANPGKCYSDSIARSKGLAYVQGASPPYRNCKKLHYENFLNCENRAVTDFRDMDESRPFIQANLDMYEIAQMSRGVWAPLRRRTDSCVENECQPQSVRREDPLCRNIDEQISDYIDDIMGQNPYTIAYSD